MIFNEEFMPKSDQEIHSNRYMLIPRTLILVIRGDEVLLIKGGPRKRLWANLYNGIGGHIERGEDVITAARRELKEEAGLIVADLCLVGTILVDASDSTGVGIYVMRGNFIGGKTRSSEEGELEWVKMSDLDRLPLVEDLKIILRRMMSMRTSDAPFSARSYYDADDRLQVLFG
jgi:8-oxo-dGTP diphosphatase